MIPKSLLISLIVNVLVVAIIIYLQLGPIKLWKKVISPNGDISWLWFSANMFLLLLISVFIVTNISIYIKSYSGEPERTVKQAKKPSLQFQLSDNLFDDNEIKKPGVIIYDGLITLPVAEKKFIKDLFIELRFPIIIERFEMVNEIGVENSKIQLGPENIIELKEKEGFKIHTELLILEVKKLKPGAFFRFKAYSLHLPNRNVNREVDYLGYFYWETDDGDKKEDIRGKFSPQFYKIAEINLKKWKLLSEAISKIDPKKGTFVFWTSDPRWYEKNGFFIDFIPPFEKQDFKIRMFRDRDNIFKCELKTYYHKDVILQFKELEKLYNEPKHPKHMIGLTWDKESNKLYIDGELVDSYPKRH